MVLSALIWACALWNGSFGSMSLLFGKCALGMAQLAPERGEFMKKVRDLQAVFAQLRALAARGDIEPRRKQLLEQAIETLKRFRRNKNPNRAEIFRCVRDVAEKLLEAFLV